MPSHRLFIEELGAKAIWLKLLGLASAAGKS